MASTVTGGASTCSKVLPRIRRPANHPGSAFLSTTQCPSYCIRSSSTCQAAFSSPASHYACNQAASTLGRFRTPFSVIKKRKLYNWQKLSVRVATDKLRPAGKYARGPHASASSQGGESVGDGPRGGSKGDDLAPAAGSCDVDTVGDALMQWRFARLREGVTEVDWGRYHLQVMFVDHNHMARARLAEGLFSRIAAWAGAGLALYPHSCGINAVEGETLEERLQVEAQRLGLSRYIFRAPCTTLDRSDLDMYDLLIAVDISVRDDILRMVARESPDSRAYYARKIRLLCDFAVYGGVADLEDELAAQLVPALPQAQTAMEVTEAAVWQHIAWQNMVALLTLSCAGLVRFLLQQYPDDLPDYDPVD